MLSKSSNSMGSLMQKCLSFDDVLMVPQKSDIKSRKEIEIGNSLGDYYFRLPIISSPMDTVTEEPMAIEMSRLGGLGVIHRYNSIEEQSLHVAKTRKQSKAPVAAAIGVTGDYLDRAASLHESGCRILCIDVAHGHHTLTQSAIVELRKNFGEDVVIIAGNVATPEAFSDLQDWGADAIRVGIGGGSICSTRLQTGPGVSTFQSIAACRFVKKHAKMIADGGIKTSGDIVKSLGAGADFVMLGSMLAATTESPGEVFTSNNGIKTKVYRGMASSEAQINWRGKTSSLEGISATIPFKGPVEDIVSKLKTNIRSGFSYSGARNQSELKKKASFIQQSSSSRQESAPHILRK